MIYAPNNPAVTREPCPTRQELDAFVCRDLHVKRFREVDAHRRACAECQNVISHIIRNSDLPHASPMR